MQPEMRQVEVAPAVAAALQPFRVRQSAVPLTQTRSEKLSHGWPASGGVTTTWPLTASTAFATTLGLLQGGDRGCVQERWLETGPRRPPWGCKSRAAARMRGRGGLCSTWCASALGDYQPPQAHLSPAGTLKRDRPLRAHPTRPSLHTGGHSPPGRLKRVWLRRKAAAGPCNCRGPHCVAGPWLQAADLAGNRCQWRRCRAIPDDAAACWVDGADLQFVLLPAASRRQSWRSDQDFSGGWGELQVVVGSGGLAAGEAAKRRPCAHMLLEHVMPRLSLAFTHCYRAGLPQLGCHCWTPCKQRCPAGTLNSHAADCYAILPALPAHGYLGVVKCTGSEGVLASPSARQASAVTAYSSSDWRLGMGHVVYALAAAAAEQGGNVVQLVVPFSQTVRV